MTRDAQLLIRTHLRDLDWLHASLCSVRKFWNSEYPPVIVATPECEGLFPMEVKELGAIVHLVPAWPDQRAGANYIGLTADLYAEAPIVLLIDSDCMFKTQVSAENFMQNDKIVVRGDLWENINEPHNQIYYDMYREWVKESIGLTAQYETMRHHPFMFFREDFAGARALIQKTTGRDAETWTKEWRNSKGSSEFNLLGTYCIKGDRPYVFLPPLSLKDQLVQQFHSWSQTPFDCIDEIGAILA